MNDPQDHDPYRSPAAETAFESFGSAPTRGARPWDAVEAFRFAWEGLKRFPISILAAFIVSLVAGIVAGIGSVAQNVMGMSGDEDLMVLGWVIYGASFLVNIPVAAWMQLGMARYSIAMARGQRPEFGVLFRTDGLLAAVLTQIVITIGATVLIGAMIGPSIFLLMRDEESVLGFTLLGFGALISMTVGAFFSVRWAFFNFAIAAGERGVGAVLARSWRLTDGIFWRIVLLVVLAALLSIVGMIVGICALCIGLMVTMPAVQLMNSVASAYGYLHQTGELPVQIPSQSTSEPAAS